MSVEATARKLTDAHRVAQANIATDAVGKLVAVWKHLMKPSNLDDYAAYLNVMTEIIKTGRTSSAQLSAAYYSAERDLFGVDNHYAPMLFDEIPIQQIQTSLIVTGPVRVKTLLGNGETMESALSKAMLASAGAATRHIANGGRDTVRGNVQHDDRATGWRRVTDGNPCSFCAMLAGRGAVYKSAETAGINQDHYHDHCGCTVEALFRARVVKRASHGR